MNSPSPHDLQEQLRKLPSVDQVLRSPAVSALLDELPHTEVTRAVRVVLEQQRAALRAGASVFHDPAMLALEIRETLFRRQQSHLRKVINATGIVLHTGLGRSPLAAEAIEAIADVAAGYCNLEFDLETGERGDRHSHVREPLCELTGAEDALVVNNNAAATFLALKALTENREVIVSRGQLVEIGGSYRMPDVMAAAGCRMVEVGTTNRTRIADYRQAMTPNTAALLRVHTSNFRIQGFTEETPLTELATLARTQNPALVVVDDLGSGLLDAAWIPSRAADDAAGTMPSWHEPSVRDSLAAGADLTLFSGDKLLGGPQAGILVGKTVLISRIRAHPLMRALRPDKLSLAALEATLRLYRDPDALARRLPTARMLSVTAAALEAIARRLTDLAARISPDLTVIAEPDTSFAGGGALPTVELPTWVVRMQHPRVAAQALATSLRMADTPVIARIQSDYLIFDCRTLATDELEELGSALTEALRDV